MFSIESIRGKLLVPILLMAATSAVLAGISWYFSTVVKESTRQLTQASYESLTAEQIRGLSRAIQRDTLNMIFDPTAEGRKSFQKSVDNRAAQMREKVGTLVSTLDAESKQALPDYEALQAKVLNELAEAQRMGAEGKQAEAYTFFRENVRAAERAASKLSDSFIDTQNEKVAALQEALTATQSRSLKLQLIIGAVLVLLALGLHAGVLYTITAQSRAIPLYIAIAALIPAIRSMEEVGDVQAAIGLGLVLPLLLLASPVIAPLILPLAIGAALANPDARRDPRAFVAMLLVALLPTLIVAIGIFGFLAQAGFDLADALLPYVNTYSRPQLSDPTSTLLALAAFAPVGLVPLVYCIYRGLPERRQIVSALLVLGLPLYLVLLRSTFVPAMTPIVPPTALIAGFVSWLTVARLPMALRVFAVAMLAVSAAASWLLPAMASDPAWLAALGHLLPVGNLDLRPGV